MSFRIGRIWDIPIELHYSWFPVFALLTYSLATQQFALDGPVEPWHWGAALVTSLLFFAGLLAHELAHCLVARRAGIRIMGITFFIFGGMARMTAEPSRPWHEFVMAAAGPAMSLVVALASFGGAYLLAAGAPDWAGAALYLAMANLALCVFNLLPAFPMDGGRMLRATLWGLWRDQERATSIAARLSRGFGMLLIGGGLYWLAIRGSWNGLVLVLMGGFLMQSAQMSYQQVRLRQALEGRRVSGLMAEAPAPITADLSVADALARWERQPGTDVVPVYEGDRLVGLLDMERAASLARVEQPFVPVSRLVRPPRRAELVRPESAAWKALLKMAGTGRQRLYVIRHGTVLGVLSLEQVLAAVASPRGERGPRERHPV